MSDFLTNLVMRSFSGTPAVQPMTFSTYAAPEPVDVDVDVDQPPPQTLAQKPVKPTPVVNADKHESVSKVTEAAESAEFAEATETAEVDNLFIPTIQTQTPEPRKPLVIKEKSVSPPVTETKPRRVNQSSTNPLVIPPTKETGLPQQQQEKIVERTETRTEFKTEIQPAPPQQLIYHPPIQTVQPTARRLSKKQPIPIPAPAQKQPPDVSTTAKHDTSPVQKHDLEIVEHVIERPSVTIENTQQVTTSFTTLIPNTTAQPLPALNLKPRSKTALPDLPSEAEPPPSTPETVINVAIGRIEVRATPATTPKRERQQHGPKVRTLDDYLQQRSRGTQ